MGCHLHYTLFLNCLSMTGAWSVLYCSCLSTFWHSKNGVRPSDSVSEGQSSMMAATSRYNFNFHGQGFKSGLEWPTFTLAGPKKLLQYIYSQWQLKTVCNKCSFKSPMSLFKKKTSNPLPPGPPGLPLLGNIKDMPKSRPHETFTEWAKKYGIVHNPSFMILTSD